MTGVLAATTKTMPDISVVHSLIQMVIALGVVVLCIWGLGKVLARLKSGSKARPASTKRRGDGNGLTVISRQSLGKDLAVATIQWGEREVLVGIAGSTITFLDDGRRDEAGSRDEFAARDEPAAASDDAPRRSAAFGAFASEQSAPRRSNRTERSAPAPRRDRHIAVPTARSSAPSASNAPSLIETLRNATTRR